MFLGNTPGSFARSGDPFFVTYSTGNITARLRTMLSEGFGKTVNSPVLRTLNNQYATVQQETQTTIFINNVVSTGTQILTIPEPQDYTVTTGLSVAPRINEDGTITMYLTPQIEDFGQIRTGPDGTQIPDRMRQYIEVVANVKSGETIVLGGMTRKTDLGTQNKFPILGDLPLIGQFFRSNTRDKNNSELLIFVTPTIMEEDDNLGLGP